MKARYPELKSSIAEIIKCRLCDNNIQDAMMCPNCQKLFCQDCIHKWLRSNKRCFSCLLPLNFSQAIKIGFMNDLASYFNDMQLIKKLNKADLCPQHLIQMLYYCCTCNESLCSDCFVFDDKHKEHQIDRLSAIYDAQYESVKLQSRNIDKKFEEMKDRLHAITDRISELNTYSKRKDKEIKESFENMKSALENKVNSAMNKLLQAKKDITSQMGHVVKMKSTLNEEVNDLTESELVLRSNSIMKKIQEITTLIERTTNDDLIDIDIDFSFELPNAVLPSFESQYFELSNYTDYIQGHSHTGCNCINLPEMRINGQRWIAKLYPNGNEANDNEHIALFIELKEANSFSHQGKYHYRFELINWLRAKNYIQEYSSVFRQGDCWGCSRFYLIAKMESDGFIHKDKKIGLKISIRPESMELLKTDMNNYIRKLEDAIDDNHAIYNNKVLFEGKKRGRSCPSKRILSCYKLITDDNDSSIKNIITKKDIKKHKDKDKDNRDYFSNDNIPSKQNELLNTNKKTNQLKYSDDNKIKQLISERKAQLHQKENGALIQESIFQLDFNQIYQEYSAKKKQTHYEFTTATATATEKTRKKKAIDKPPQKVPITKPDTYEISLSLSCGEALAEVGNVKQFPLDKNYIIPKSKEMISNSSEESSISSIMETINNQGDYKAASKQLHRESTDYSQNLRNKRSAFNLLSGSYDAFLSKIYPENKFPISTQRYTKSNINITSTTPAPTTTTTTTNTNYQKSCSKDIRLSDLLSKRKL